MAVVTNLNKTTTAVTNQSRTGENITWDEATFTWDDSGASTWETIRVPITRDGKNSATLSNETKN